jgi:hypothetical protein
VGENLLKLMKNIIINLVSFELLKVFWLLIINRKEVISESWDHKELLEHRVHIASATKIFQTTVLLTVSGSGSSWLIIPSIMFANE